jgi:hypothetical protein
VPELYMLLATGLTSMAAYALIRVLATRPRGSFRVALWRTVECLGVSLIFLATNVLAELVLVLVARKLTGGFISLYLAGDFMIVPISCLQGLAVRWWFEVSRTEAAPRALDQSGR